LASLFVLRMSLSMLRRAKHILSFPDASQLTWKETMNFQERMLRT
jgi:hypothetical protein